MKPTIKAVCFDFYGVISLYPPGDGILSLLAALFHIPAEDFRKKYFTLNYLSNVENQSFEEVAIKTALSFNINHESENEARNLIQNLHGKRKLNTELLTWFSLLKEQGFKVGIISNATTAVREEWEKYKIFDMVDTAIVSAEVGYQKPHKEIFEILFSRLNVLPQETIFIDDAQKSLEKAQEIGYHPILFKNNEQLKADLQTFGIKL